MIPPLRCSVHVDQDIIMLNLSQDCQQKNRILCAECMEDKELKCLCPISKLSIRTQQYRTKKEQDLQDQCLTEFQLLENLIKQIVTLKDKSEQVFINLVSECQQLQQWLKQQQKDQISYYDNLFNNLTKNKLEELAEILSGKNQKNFIIDSLPKKYKDLATSIQVKSQQIVSDFSNICKILGRENKQTSYKQQRSLKQIGQFECVNGCSVLAYYKSLVFGGQLNFIQIWEQDGLNFKKSQTLSEHSDKVTALDIYKSGDVLISGSADKSLKLWQKTDKWSCFQTLFDHNGEIKEIKLTSKEEQVLSASSDKTIKVWQRIQKSNNLQLVQTIAESSDAVYNIAISEKYLAASTTWAWKCYIDVLSLGLGQWKIFETKRTDVRIQALCFSQNLDLICQQFEPAKISVYMINYSSNLELKQEISLKQFELDKCLTFPIISLDNRFFIKNSKALVVLLKTETNFYVIEQIIDKPFHYGCIDISGEYVLLINNHVSKIEIYNMSD